jgi:cold shock protein
MSTGKIKFFNNSKGFGFITQDAGEDIFFHVSQLQASTASDGAKVEYEIGEGNKGPQAMNIREVNSY